MHKIDMPIPSVNWPRHLGSVASFTASVFCVFMILWLFLDLSMSHRSTPEMNSPEVLGYISVFTLIGVALMAAAIKLFYPNSTPGQIALRTCIAYFSTGPILIGSFILFYYLITPLW